MKNFSKILLIVFLALTLVNCSKKSGTTSQEPETKPSQKEQSEYYIRYVTDVTSIYMFPNRQVLVESEEGPLVLKGVEIDMTIGPVKKGFNCALVTDPLSNENLSNTIYIAYIYVSRNNEPFALKAMSEVGPKEGHNLFYTIDY